jgi:hypothetical protein
MEGDLDLLEIPKSIPILNKRTKAIMVKDENKTVKKLGKNLHCDFFLKNKKKKKKKKKTTRKRKRKRRQKVKLIFSHVNHIFLILDP